MSLEQENTEKQEDEKIYGLYSGSIEKPREVENMDEPYLYWGILMLNSKILFSQRIEDINEDEYALDFCVYQTKKFGTDISEPEKGKRIQTGPLFQKWFQFHDHHFRVVLTDKERKDFQEAHSYEKDVSTYMPEGNWEDFEINE